MEEWREGGRDRGERTLVNSSALVSPPMSVYNKWRDVGNSATPHRASSTDNGPHSGSGVHTMQALCHYLTQHHTHNINVLDDIVSLNCISGPGNPPPPRGLQYYKRQHWGQLQFRLCTLDKQTTAIYAHWEEAVCNNSE